MQLSTAPLDPLALSFRIGHGRPFVVVDIDASLPSSNGLLDSDDDASNRPPAVPKKPKPRNRALPFQGGVDPIVHTYQDCTICFEAFDKKGAIIQNLGCKHSFCKPCLDPWVLRCYTCPYCRAVIEVIHTEHFFPGSNNGSTAETAIVIADDDDDDEA